MTTRAVIIDDELSSINVLETILQEHFKEIEIIGTSQKVSEGIKLINEKKPDLLFLDIQLKDGLGFDIVDQINYKGYSIIFITGYKDFASKAFDYAALHYLMKPVSISALKEALQRFVKTKSNINPDQLEIFKNAMSNKQINKICLSGIEGLKIVDPNDIVYCQVSKYNSQFYFTDGSYFIVSKPLNAIEEILSPLGFYRISKQNLINFNHVLKFVKGKPSHVIMQSDIELEVSSRKSDAISKSFKKFTKFV